MAATLKDLVRGLTGREAAEEDRELLLLADLSQTFARSLDLDETLNSAVGEIIDFLDAEAASLFLLDRETNELVCRASAGPSRILGLRLKVGTGIVGRALSEGTWQMVRDARADPDFFAGVDRRTGFETRSVMCVPLQSRDQSFGVLEVLNKRGDGELFSDPDLQMLRVLGAAVSLAVRNVQMAGDLVEQKRMRQEFEMARGLQQRLLPAPRHDPFPLAGINLPAREVSGDFYDYFDSSGGRIGFTIGDVSGKGLNAALLMVRTTSLLRALGRSGMPLPRLLRQVNAELCETGSYGMFVCVFAGSYDPRTARLTWANAGFPAALFRNAGGRYLRLKADSPPLGIDPDTKFREHRLHLGGGSLYLYTDGVTEARDAAGQNLEEAGLRGLIEGSAGLTPAPRLEAIAEALQNRDVRDDATLLVLEDRRRHGTERLMELSLPAQARSLRAMRIAVKKTLRAAGCPADVADRLVLALDEACANVIRHGYGADSDGMLDLALERRGKRLVFLLRDYAERVAPARLIPKKPSRKRPGGLGLHFIDTIMDQWEHRRPEDGKGNLLVMSKKVG